MKTLLEQGTCNHYIFFNGTAIGNPDGNSNWKELVDGWSDSLIKAVSQDVPGRILDNSGNPGNYTFRVDRDWRSNLSDVYGEWDNFKWYAQSDDKSDIFNKTLSLTRKMHEVDRKILYSYSLDSFSDRQQLFLYFIRAETALPALGMGSGSGSRSLAGGRAVALVWRDPYPRGYDKARASGARNENISNGPWDKKDGSGGWYQRLNDVVSPWVQYYTTPGSGQDVQASEDPRYSGGYRWNGWHDTRVLFFKQLDK